MYSLLRVSCSWWSWAVHLLEARVWPIDIIPDSARIIKQVSGKSSHIWISRPVSFKVILMLGSIWSLQNEIWLFLNRFDTSNARSRSIEEIDTSTNQRTPMDEWYMSKQCSVILIWLFLPSYPHSLWIGPIPSVEAAREQMKERIQTVLSKSLEELKN